ncbi:MAG TPA: GNAT family N-acetyltransferase [Pyrinomonadaceae bacterium]|jgi:diamine N-acetyltransferase
MSVSLREVDEYNFWQCINLKVADEQKNFVAPNVRSIAESKVFPYLVPQAIYADEELIGFALYGRDPESGNYWIVRLMIDEKFQGKGYGKAATLGLIEKIRRLPDSGDIYLSFVPGNAGAEKLYRSVGFERTGETDADGEVIMRLSMKNNVNRQTAI